MALTSDSSAEKEPEEVAAGRQRGGQGSGLS